MWYLIDSQISKSEKTTVDCVEGIKKAYDKVVEFRKS
jgi:hypothetical protein